MRRIKRPEALRAQGWAYNDDFIAPAVRESLSRRLPRRIGMEERREFLRRCSWAAQEASEAARARAPAHDARQGKRKTSVEQLERVANRARALQQAMNAMSEEVRRAFGAHFDVLALRSKPELRINGMPPASAEDATPPDRLSRLSQALVQAASRERIGEEFYGEVCEVRRDFFFQAVFDLVSDLELGARFAISQCKLGRQGKRGEQMARALVWRVAASFRALFGSLPPRNKGTWFPEFMEELGRFVGLRCGLRLTRAVLLAMAGEEGRRPTSSP